MAGRDFMWLFMHRNRLSLRTPQKTSIARTMGFNRTLLGQYFNNLEDVLSKYQFTPVQVCYIDETGIQTVPINFQSTLHRLEKKVVKPVSAEQGQTVTIACAVGATGHQIPPYFIFAKKEINLLLILLILDNYSFHTNVELINYARSCHIQMLSLPPHSNQKIQPLDRIFSKPFKTFYYETTDDWTACHPGHTLSIYHFAEIAAKAFQETATVEKVVEGFLTDQDLEQNHDPANVIDAVAEIYQSEKEPQGGAVTKETKGTILVKSGMDMSSTSSLSSLSGTTSHTSPCDIISLPKLKVRRKRSGKESKVSFTNINPKQRKVGTAERENGQDLFQCAKPIVGKRKLPREGNFNSSESDCDSLMSIYNTSSEFSLISSKDEDCLRRSQT
ncbi:hypothetical protein ILUMI_07476 [Ignelater luminosus]|uniref:DDE-1 domain-containing protein n=1 Tax=Ignelater luminosus TaxID=2038154 RepID=A0A8K0D889_IGNLU|nr:hypothetical protein ILUMI_07476 [Ignelater luminosus]